MSEEVSIEKPVSRQFNFFLIQVVNTVISGFFLSIWGAVQYGVNSFIGMLQPIGRTDQIVFWAFQFIFAVMTLIPVIIYYYVDTKITLIRAKKTIAQEEQKGYGK